MDTSSSSNATPLILSSPSVPQDTPGEVSEDGLGTESPGRRQLPPRHPPPAEVSVLGRLVGLCPGAAQLSPHPQHLAGGTEPWLGPACSGRPALSKTEPIIRAYALGGKMGRFKQELLRSERW